MSFLLGWVFFWGGRFFVCVSFDISMGEQSKSDTEDMSGTRLARAATLLFCHSVAVIGVAME